MEEDRPTDQTPMRRKRDHLGPVDPLVLLVQWVLKVTREAEENPENPEPLVLLDQEDLLEHPDNQAKMVMTVVMVTRVQKGQPVLPVFLECLESLDCQEPRDTGAFLEVLERRVTLEDLEKGELMVRLDLQDPQEITDPEVCLETEEQRGRKDHRVNGAEMVNRVPQVQSARADRLAHRAFLGYPERRVIKAYLVRKERQVSPVHWVSMDCQDPPENLEGRDLQGLMEPRVREESGVSRELPVVLVSLDPRVSLD